MRTTTSLCFTENGLINEADLASVELSDSMQFILFGDGSRAGYEAMRAFDWTGHNIKLSQLAVARIPLFSLQVVNRDGDLSYPQYVYEDRNRMDWFISTICSACMSISACDMSSNSDTKVVLDRHQVTMMCKTAHEFWTILKVAENCFSFPAIVIDALVRHSRILNQDNIDIVLLRRETGLENLDYHPASDMLSVDVGSETFVVKLSLVNDFFEEFVLPFFNRYRGRRYHLEVSVTGLTGGLETPRVMSYGELGHTMEQVRSLVKETRLDNANPFKDDDLLPFAKRLKADNESCVFGSDYPSLEALFTDAESIVWREAIGGSDRRDIEELPSQAVLEHA